MSTTQPPHVIGWRERVDLPAWDVSGIKAKIDTGARTSAIDVAQIETLDDNHIRFEIVTRLKPTRKTTWVTAECHRVSRVRPSSGDLQERIVCRTLLRVGDHEHEIDLSLVCRKRMLCRMLIGRTALAGHFLVDSSRKYVLTSPPRRRASRESKP